MLLWIIVGVFALVAFAVIKNKQFQKEYPIPGPPPLPILGNVLDVVKADSFMVLASEWLSKYGNVIQVFLVTKRLIMIGRHPEAVKDIFSHSTYIKGIVRKEFEGLTGQSGMIFADGEIWSKVRKSCNEAFNKDHLRLFEDPMRLCAQVLVDQLQKNSSKIGSVKMLDMDDFFVKVTLDVLGKTMLSSDFQSLTSTNAAIPHYVDMWLQVTVRNINNPFHYLVAPTSSFVQKTAIKYLHNFVQQLIESRIKAREQNKSEHKDLLDLLLDVQNPESGAGLTKLEVQEQVLTFLVAGHETTAHTLAFAVSCVSRNPQILAKIREELNQVLGKDADIIPGYEQCTKLTYLGAVIKETLRMHPIAPAIVRQLQEDHKVAGYDLKAGQIVLLDLVATHYDPETWEHPTVFNPDRFLQVKPENEIPTFQSFEFSPFGHGRRSCIGQHFATLEMKILLSALFRRFRFQHAPLRSTTSKETVTFRPKHGLMMSVWEDQ